MDIKQFSPHLFWDVDVNKLDFEKSEKLIIHRVLDYGLISDWKLIHNYYGINKIAKTSVTIRDLSNRSMSFISLLSNTQKEDFLCYTTKRLIPKHWDF